MAKKGNSKKTARSKCALCTGLCCRYVALEIDKPETKKDFDDIRWYVAHRGVSVFVDRGRWYIEFRSKCKYLTDDYKCAIYEKRPTICRRHSTENCEFGGGPDHDMLFKTPEQIEEYYEELKRRRRKKKARKKTKNKAGKA